METITTNRLTLRPLIYSDAKALIQYHSDLEVSRYQGCKPKSDQEIRTWVDQSKRCDFPAPGKWLQCAIVLRKSAELIGDFGIHAKEIDPRQVEIGITLASAFQRNGFALETMEALLNYLFRKTETHRIFVSIDPRNTPSLKLFLKLNFRQEAHLIESLWFKGEWVDDVIMAILKKEWMRTVSPASFKN